MTLVINVNRTQISHLKIPGEKAVYGLVGVVIQQKLSANLSHSVFIRSTKDRTKWFYVNDSQVYM